MTISRPEEHIPLPSEAAMKYQWQELPDLFMDVSWSTKKDGNYRLIFTAYCIN